MTTDGAFRIALLAAWNDRCAWCRAPMALTEMQVDHVVPKTLVGPKLAAALDDLGQASDYNLEASYNLVPACRRCNRFKGDKVPPNAPIIVFFLRQVRAMAAKVDSAAVRLKQMKKVDQALALLESFAGIVLSEEQLNQLADASEEAQPEIIESTGTRVTLHPALAMLLDPTAWSVVKEVSPDTVVVRNGGQVGYTSPKLNFVCGRCGSHGPWSGARCLTCGALDDGA